MSTNYYEPVYKGDIGVGKGVILLKLPNNPDKQKETEARKQQNILSKAHSTKSKVYTRNWKEFHKRKQAKLFDT